MKKYPAINKNRPDVYAVAVIEGGRAKGQLFGSAYNKNDPENDLKDVLWRDSFNVKVKDGRFKVDIGTGSGVHVHFDVNRSESV